MGMPDDEPIEHPLVTRSIENAQRKVEERNFDIRKHLLEYDDVMNAQRKTVYALRQALLLGRYEPEELDELGKPTGKARKVEVNPEIEEYMKPLVPQLLAYFADPPLDPKDKEGKSRAPRRKDFKSVDKIVDLEALQREVYTYWGVKLEVEGRKKRTALELHDEIVKIVVQGLSEQRERMLDLIDKEVSAIVEESCPENKPPEDWDWGGIRDGFREHFKVKLDSSIEDIGDPEHLVRHLYEKAEALYVAKEQELRADLAMRLFRNIYLESIDQTWVDHLQSMEHLRDGIGLRGYGQRDPKNEYKKEGYDMFLNMMAKVSGTVLQRFFETQIQAKEEVEAMEAEVAAEHEALLDGAVARHPGADGTTPEEQLAQVREAAAAAPQPQRPAASAAPKIGRNDPCPCGSGKKFKKCHGAALEDDEDGDQPRA
jgi:preprotein translocase subunit SecA